MKFNWKVLIALGLVVVAAFWAVTSVNTYGYNGAKLNFGIGTGNVTVTNPSDTPVHVQLIGTGSRSFTMSNTIPGVTGYSTRQGSGSSTTQLFEFDLPPGTNVFNIARGANVKFVTDADTRLTATVEPLSQNDARTTVIIAIVVILGSLYFASRTTGHGWLSALRRKPAPVEAPVVQTAETKVAANRGRDGRAYSDS